MLVVPLGNGVSLDYYNHEAPIATQHYAFLVGDHEFDAVFGRIKQRKIRYWADPGRQREGELYEHNGGRGFYFDDPDGHLLEVMTRAYDLGAYPA
jgi:catechol 2,3-dioxygenase-like lactoylglutathione lyase family enzyme